MVCTQRPAPDVERLLGEFKTGRAFLKFIQQFAQNTYTLCRFGMIQPTVLFADCARTFKRFTSHRIPGQLQRGTAQQILVARYF